MGTKKSVPLPVIEFDPLRTSGVHRTKIEWADYAVNPIRARNGATGRMGWACTKVSDGCTHCYAEALNVRFGTGLRFSAQSERVVEWVLDLGVLGHMLRFRPKRPFKRVGVERPVCFVGDMTDLFHPRVPEKWHHMLWVVFAARPDVDWVILTKRPDRMAAFVVWRFDPVSFGCVARELLGRRDIADECSVESVVDRFDRTCGVLPNVWLGTSVESSRHLHRLDDLSKVDASVYVVSFEPLLEMISPQVGEGLGRLAARVGGRWDRIWTIFGGESGSGARQTNVEDIRQLMRACSLLGTSCFMKQLGSRPVEPNCGQDMPTSWVPDDSGEAVERWYRPINKKGADPAEWHPDLRRREWPL